MAAQRGAEARSEAPRPRSIVLCQKDPHRGVAQLRDEVLVSSRPFLSRGSEDAGPGAHLGVVKEPRRGVTQGRCVLTCSFKWDH